MSKKTAQSPTISWGWYISAGILAVLASAFTGYLMSFGTLFGQITGGNSSYHPHRSAVRIRVYDSKDASEFLNKARNDCEEEKQALFAELKSACAKANLPTPPTKSRPLDEISSSEGFNTAMRLTMDLATVGLWELFRGGFAKSDERAQLRYDVERASWRYYSFPVAGYVFKRIPDNKIVGTATTDDGGKFKLILERGKKYLLVADTRFDGAVEMSSAEKKRLFHAPDKKCYWLLWVSLNGKPEAQLNLSTSKMTDSSDNSNAFECTCYDLWQDQK